MRPRFLARAEKLLADARAKGLKIATAESCTGGLIAGLLTEIAGSSDVFERGFVTYSNEAKQELLGVPQNFRHDGAVSAEVARAMALGALKHAQRSMAVAVTGIAGPTAARRKSPSGWSIWPPRAASASSRRECRFGEIGRREVRLASVEVALELLTQLV